MNSHENQSVSFRVLFKDPFWIGICEKTCGGQLYVSKVTFGAEPKEYDVKEFILKNWYYLHFSTGVEVKEYLHVRKNPKRMQREVKKQLENTGIGTKSMQALKQQHEQNKIERKIISKEQKKQMEERQYELRKVKRKEKHKGR